MKKILIIEDDLDIQELIQFFLEDQGYEVITASDGIDGIAVFLKEQIDLILLDILLPKMDGYAVCELIRKESEVPIIMISALGREEDQIKGFEMQIDDYIPKPISLPIMIKKIEAVLRRYEGVDITKDHELKYREIILIVGNYQVKIGKKLIDLTQKEYEILKELGLENDRLFALAMELEKIALNDEYFVSRKLYPNVDFYSGIVLSAIGIPVSMFTPIFALARTVGWISHWTEMIADPGMKIGRPRQLYTGSVRRDYVQVGNRK